MATDDEPDLLRTAATLLDHVAVAAHDATASADWFEQTLGLRREHDEIVADAGVRLVWLYPSGKHPGGQAAAMQIVQPLRAGPVASHLSERGEGLHHVCFAVPDLARTLTEAAESTERIFVGGYGYPCAFLNRHPPGCAIELVEKPA
ncbi:glyoxalase/bleomycin resistance protein/dioxygenase superfamily protein [Tamaricihabitans halophyticus]|uniref:Glyoxalase/bleomycin resistance protein/dioxygenase superfamily protein n=1 Tax=Tamaricihabitans halophyticus TaxID=1262583 RepID=A0A4R2PSW1_9PSEU|nr:VOC family protein [Tamaricihabitans halophyticus]TCP39053.1 glyoxalase/bleomycin resistance protein/dioxygenase superfamily protein [Tamaricihabitans halophyticus]